ncbi:MAG: hypothetical protein ACJAVI_002513 [Candidatus Azotimanducaceae bacterium]|jgi:hypothetical protein
MKIASQILFEFHSVVYVGQHLLFAQETSHRYSHSQARTPGPHQLN